MSTYVNSRARQIARAAQRVAEIVNASETTTDAMARAAEIVRQYGSQLNLRTVLTASDVTNLQEYAAATPRLTALDPTNDLAEIVRQAAADYSQAARAVTADAMIASAKAIGFEWVGARADATTTAIDARMGDSVLLATVSTDGTIQREWMVGPGQDCAVLDAQLSAELTKRGIELGDLEVDHHGGRRDGERLILPAVSRSPEAPAEGALAAAREADSAPRSGPIIVGRRAEPATVTRKPVVRRLA